MSRNNITDDQRLVEHINHTVHHLRAGKWVIRIAHGRHVVKHVAAYLSLNTTYRLIRSQVRVYGYTWTPVHVRIH